jgi:hypothetical protein
MMSEEAAGKSDFLLSSLETGTCRRIKEEEDENYAIVISNADYNMANFQLPQSEGQYNNN